MNRAAGLGLPVKGLTLLVGLSIAVHAYQGVENLSDKHGPQGEAARAFVKGNLCASSPVEALLY